MPAPPRSARVDLMEATVRKGADGFGLGRVEALSRVEGGLSNDMWRVRCSEEDVAVKVMRAHADAPEFRGNVEAAFEIELRAHPKWCAGMCCRLESSIASIFLLQTVTAAFQARSQEPQLSRRSNA